ncbi:MAG: RidA family protein [Pseudonocardiaceae bacterium]|nr:RidA family protein [Pseudonocardiaceae bacterium]
MSPEQRLAAMDLRLPDLRPVAGRYRPWVRHGDLLFLSGQGAQPHVGRLGADFDVAQGRLAARDCMLNLLAQTRAAAGSLERVRQVVKVLGFVRCTPEFTDTPAVLDGASELLVHVFGDRGEHARSAIGVASLPRGFAVEIELVVALDAESV